MARLTDVENHAPSADTDGPASVLVYMPIELRSRVKHHVVDRGVSVSAYIRTLILRDLADDEPA